MNVAKHLFEQGPLLALTDMCRPHVRASEFNHTKIQGIDGGFKLKNKTL